VKPTGVLLVNVGSPDEPSPAAVRRYLAEFLGDPAVVQLPRALWLPLLYGVILPLRARRSAQLYCRIWTPDGSPLVSISRAQAQALMRELGQGFEVEPAMRYGRPALDAAIARLAARCREIVLVPMFPQYSDTTSGSVIAAVRARVPESVPLRVVSAFFDDPEYLAAQAALVRAHARDSEVDHYLFSFHGIPVRYVERGDPYQVHCERTAAALAKELGLGAERWSIVYQSRFGRERWLEPYALDLLPRIAAKHPRVAVVCPAFTADCLETLEEVHQELGAVFRASGGRAWTVVPCLNVCPPWIRALASIVRRRAVASTPKSVEPG
jgi:ferrochelatase